MKIRNRTAGRVTWAACLLVPVAGLAIAAAGEAGAKMDSASAAQALVALLDEAGREKALFSLDDEERFNWHFVPRSRNGLPLANMTTEQRAAAHDLLQAAMSSQGFLKASAIIELERILGLLEGRPERRDPENYYVAIFGDPSSEGPWAWRFEGHHLSLNFSSPSGLLTVTGPAFMGANPARVPSGPKAGWRPLGREEDLARALMRSFTPDQRERATIAAEAPSDILTGNDREARLDGFEGLPADAMTAEQRAILFEIVHEYAGNTATDADWRMRPRERDSGGRHPLRLGGVARSRRGTLLPGPRPGLSHRVRQHAERREPRPLGVAGPGERLRGRRPGAPLRGVRPPLAVLGGTRSGAGATASSGR